MNELKKLNVKNETLPNGSTIWEAGENDVLYLNITTGEVGYEEDKGSWIEANSNVIITPIEDMELVGDTVTLVWFSDSEVGGKTLHGINLKDENDEWLGCDELKKALKKCAPFRAILKDHGIGWRDFSNYGQAYIELSFGEVSILMGKWNGVYDYNVCSIKGDKIKKEENVSRA